MPTEGERLSKELRFRLRSYTAVVLILFLLSHVSAYDMARRYICRCEIFPVPGVSADTVQTALYAVIGLLYLAGWIEVVRMLYARWWPHWGTLAAEANPAEATRTGFPFRHRVLALLAATAFVVIFACEAFESGQHPYYGWHTGVFAGLLGSFIGSYGAWFVRVVEPLLPLAPPDQK